ncbi:histidine kinase [Variovorax sp. J22R133]|uniref:sensor histidine kinase n=1 Tax=Variovorax brevis TaxID=3053503 RepID=UPI002577D236|nr:histidine kinase [Variovorax sp. J22R133]MDM0113345.1 histidine kinase [Variovorax sp. J22R133]
MKIEWRDVARRGLQVVAFCLVIAAMTSTIWPNKGYLNQLGYSLCIGGITWAVIEFGRLAMRKPDDPGGWPQGLRRALLITAGIATGAFLGSMLGDTLFMGDAYASFMDSRRDQRISWMITVLAGVAGSYYFYSRGHRASLAARVSAAERDASEARLKLLETQLEPHMLFNTLANLRVLIATDPPRAIAMLDRLNNYLRSTLSGSRKLSHPLSAEFDRLGDYLELMSVRMGDRLRYTLDLPAELRDVPVPPLLLQPLVENSIRHGLEPKVEGGEIVVRARRDEMASNGGLCIEVCDTGVGIDADLPSDADSFGLAQIRERLATVYGAGGTLRLGAVPNGGTRATIHIPLHA